MTRIANQELANVLWLVTDDLDRQKRNLRRPQSG